MKQNEHQLIGHVGQDPQARHTESGKMVINMTIATDGGKDSAGNKLTDWHNITFWDKLAEIVEKYVKKGSQILVSGPSKTRSYTDKEGATRYTTEVQVSDLRLLGNTKATTEG